VSWVAIWAPGPGRLRWELTVTDERGNVAMQERSAALYASPRPGDGLLVAMGLCPAGDWQQGENGSVSCPVITSSDAREDALMTGLLARQRSDPGTRVH